VKSQVPQAPIEHLNEPVLRFVRKDFTTFRRDFTVDRALALIRSVGVGERVVYFYVIDEDERLIGVVPTRRLLKAPGDRTLAVTDVCTVLFYFNLARYFL
jgi:magnesium transporter